MQCLFPARGPNPGLLPEGGVPSPARGRRRRSIHPQAGGSLHHGDVVMVPQRVEVAGAELQLLVLAADPTGCIGVDLASGALVRSRHPGGGSRLRPYDVATARLAEPDDPDWSRPELVTLAAPPRRTGHLGRWRAERYV